MSRFGKKNRAAFPLSFSFTATPWGELALRLFCNSHPRAKYLARLKGALAFIISSAQWAELPHLLEALALYVLSEGRYPRDNRPPLIEHLELCCCREAEETLSFTLSSETLLPLRREETDFGEVFVVFEDTAVGLYRLVIAPGKGILTHQHRCMDEHELILGDGLLLQGNKIASGISHHWPRYFPHRYDNPSMRPQVVLCIDHPAFLAQDELILPSHLQLETPPQERRKQWW